MFCRKCGKFMPDDSVYCPACGTRVTESPEVSTAPAGPAAASGPSRRPFPLSDWFSFRGRMGRKEWWIRSIVLWLLLIPVWIWSHYMDMADWQISFSGTDTWNVVDFLWIIAFGIAQSVSQFSVNARRLHDRNNRGWWLLLVFVPLLGWIVGLLLLIECGFLKGTSGTNRFGPDPLC